MCLWEVPQPWAWIVLHFHPSPQDIPSCHLRGGRALKKILSHTLEDLDVIGGFPFSFQQLYLENKIRISENRILKTKLKSIFIFSTILPLTQAQDVHGSLWVQIFFLSDLCLQSAVTSVSH